MKIYTNSSGIATADLTDGVRTYYVKKSGFVTASDQFAIQGANVNIGVSLVSASPLVVPYQVPQINSASDYGTSVYFDSSYAGGDSDGTESKPYTHPNTAFTSGIPSNTAILLKRGETFDKIGMNGTTRIPAMVYNGNMIGAYGTGARPTSTRCSPPRN